MEREWRLGRGIDNCILLWERKSCMEECWMDRLLSAMFEAMQDRKAAIPHPSCGQSDEYIYCHASRMPLAMFVMENSMAPLF